MNWTGPSTFGRPLRISALAAGLLALWILTHLLAAAPQCHRELHPDASSAQHQCLLTEFAGASFEPAVSPPLLVPVREPLPAPVASVKEAPVCHTFFDPLAPRPPPVAFLWFSQSGI